METLSTLGVVIRQRRCELGLTQEQLADRIGGGVRQAEVSRLEHDRVVLPRRPRLERIAAALDLPVGTLLQHAGWSGAEAAFSALPADPSPVEQGPILAANEPASTLDLPRVPGDLPENVLRLREVLARSREIREQSNLVRARIDAHFHALTGRRLHAATPADDAR